MFNNQGNKIGLWFEGAHDGNYFLVDFDSSPIMMSAMTKNNVLKYVSYAKDGNYYKPFGNTIAYYPSGNVKAIGEEGDVIAKEANLGFCEFFWFKCAGARTCDAWVSGGPIKK